MSESKPVERNSEYKISVALMAVGLVMSILGFWFGEEHMIMQIGGLILGAAGKLGYSIPRGLSKGRVKAAEALAAGPADPLGK